MDKVASILIARYGDSYLGTVKQAGVGSFYSKAKGAYGAAGKRIAGVDKQLAREQRSPSGLLNKPALGRVRDAIKGVSSAPAAVAKKSRVTQDVGGAVHALNAPLKSGGGYGRAVSAGIGPKRKALTGISAATTKGNMRAQAAAGINDMPPMKLSSDIAASLQMRLEALKQASALGKPVGNVAAMFKRKKLLAAAAA